jgi:hypothetical protein
MRWRVLMNSLERTRARDALERMSIAVEQLGPLIAAAMFIPTTLVLSSLGGLAGYTIATGGTTIPAHLARYMLLVAVGLSVVGPILLPAADRTNAVRLLLLPISRTQLWVAQYMASVADPWIVLAIPLLIFIPVGMVVAGAFGWAAIAAVAAVLLFVVLLGLASLSTTALHLLVRDRRRGELVALVAILALPTLVMLPTLMNANGSRRGGSERRDSRATPAWAVTLARQAFAVLPSELHHAAITRPAVHGAAASAAPLAGLAAMGGAIFALGFVAFGATLSSPASTGARRAAGSLSTWSRRFPGFSHGASAVALNQWRLVARTPRGRSILVSPLLVFGVFAMLMWRAGGEMEFGFITLSNGFALAIFGAAVSLLSILPFAMNQFAVDRAGLTLQLLSPLSDRDILVGKALGNGMIALSSSIFCVLIAWLVFPGGSPAIRLTIPLGLVATYLLAVPAAAALSATFPRAVDLNSIGNGSNAHQAAGLLGTLAFAAAAAPPVLITLVAITVFRSPAAAPLFVALWCAVALVASRALLAVTARLFAGRRENLGLVV